MTWNIFDGMHCLVMIGLSGAMGVICGLFSYLLDYCFWRGNVFGWYLPWLAGRIVRGRDMGTWKRIASMGRAGDDAMTSEAEKYGLYKMLGGCSVCLNVHIAFWTWVVICLVSPLEWYYGFPYVLVSSLVIRGLVGAVY